MTTTLALSGSICEAGGGRHRHCSLSPLVTVLCASDADSELKVDCQGVALRLPAALPKQKAIVPLAVAPLHCQWPPRRQASSTSGGRALRRY
jgi:hypothetical protein